MTGKCSSACDLRTLSTNDQLGKIAKFPCDRYGKRVFPPAIVAANNCPGKIKKLKVKPPVPPKPDHIKQLSSKFHTKQRLFASKDYKKPTYIVTKRTLAEQGYAVGKLIKTHTEIKRSTSETKRSKTIYLFDQLEDAFKALSIRVADSLRDDAPSSDEDSPEVNSDEFEEQWLDPLEKEGLNKVEVHTTPSLDSFSTESCPTTPHNELPPVLCPSPESSHSDDSSNPSASSSEACESEEAKQCLAKKAFNVAKEMFTSEKSYVDNIRLLNVVFRNFLLDKGAVIAAKTERQRDSSSSIAENTLDHILHTLPNLQTLSEEILNGFETRVTSWQTLPKIADVLLEKAPYLKLYVTYIKDLQKQTNLLERCAQRHSYFGQCLKQFEGMQECLKIPVSKHMLVPLQRVVKYKELLKQYLKYTPKGLVDHEDAMHALSIVLEVAEDSNEAIKQWESTARLLALQDRLNGVAISECQENNISASLTHVLVEPGRTLIKDGPLLKINRSSTKAVYLILLSDVLLYTSESQPGSKTSPLKFIDRLPLEGMRVEIPKAAEFQTEFSVISTTRSFAIQASSPKERDEWISSLVEAVDSNQLRRSSLQLPNTAKYEVPSNAVLGKQAPVWIPDNRVTMCQGCTAEFTFTFRRHHCRACGKVVCHICSSNRAPLQYMDFETARVCQTCFDVLRKDFESSAAPEQPDFEDSVKRRTHSKLKNRFKRGTREGASHYKAKPKPDRLLECAGGDFQSQMCGYLTHLKDKAWRQSWFVLKNKVLYEYRAPADVCALQSTPVLGYDVKTEFQEVGNFEGMDPTKSFLLHHKNQPPMVFHAESPELATKWKHAMQEAVVL